MPGLAFFYAGLLHKRSAVTMIMQNFASMGIITILVSPPFLVYSAIPVHRVLTNPARFAVVSLCLFVVFWPLVLRRGVDHYVWHVYKCQ